MIMPLDLSRNLHGDQDKLALQFTLSKAGFENFSKADFLDARLSYQDADSTTESLHLLGRLTVMTKQLDMALSNDSIAKWYTNDFMKKLGIPIEGGDK